MKAVRVHRHGGPDVLVSEDTAEPALAPGELLVAGEIVASAAVDVSPGRRVMLQPGISGGRCAACLSWKDNEYPRFEVLGHMTNHRGVDVVIEHVGETTWPKSVASLARGGRLVTCGATTGVNAAIDLRTLLSRQLSISGSYLGSKAS